jgi:DNA-binding HxlR family transcriptional regulator
MVRPAPYPDAFTAQCPTREILDRIGNKWASLVLLALADGPHGHRELLRRIHGVSQKMLTQTLRHLERDGIVQFTRIESVPPQSRYELTPLGSSLLPVLAAVRLWAQVHIADVVAARSEFDGRCASGRDYAGR